LLVSHAATKITLCRALLKDRHVAVPCGRFTFTPGVASLAHFSVTEDGLVTAHRFGDCSHLTSGELFPWRPTEF
jgi:hypothetical protein